MFPALYSEEDPPGDRERDRLWCHPMATDREGMRWAVAEEEGAGSWRMIREISSMKTLICKRQYRCCKQTVELI